MYGQTVYIQISRLLKKPSGLNIHSLHKQIVLKYGWLKYFQIKMPYNGSVV